MRVFIVRDLHDFSLWQRLDKETNPKNRIIFGVFSVERRKTFETSSAARDVESSQKCNDRGAPVRIILPFKDQRSANSVRRQLNELSRKVGK